MIENFNNIPWHDAELQEIIINRQNDSVIIKIKFQDEFDYSTIEFFDCYAFHANMHFGFAPPDYILDAECINDSQELNDLKKTWRTMNVDLQNLKLFKIFRNLQIV